MRISLDTNVWIFGILERDPHCEKILINLANFEVIIPDQVRKELSDNLSQDFLKFFYQLALSRMST